MPTRALFLLRCFAGRVAPDKGRLGAQSFVGMYTGICVDMCGGYGYTRHVCRHVRSVIDAVPTIVSFAQLLVQPLASCDDWRV